MMLEHISANLKELSLRLFLVGVSLLIGGCSLEASLLSLTSKTPLQPSIESVPESMDIVDGEVATTPDSVKVVGAFSDVSERVELGNGVIVEGAVYE